MVKNSMGAIRDVYDAFCDWFEKYLVIATLGSFVLGIFIAKYSDTFSDYINTVISNFVDV